MSKRAYETHDDAKEENNPGIRSRLSGMAEIGGDVTLSALKRACKNYAENGNDPFAMGTVEAGLFLSEDEYEQLRNYAKSLSIVHGKRRRS